MKVLESYTTFNDYVDAIKQEDDKNLMLTNFFHVLELMLKFEPSERIRPGKYSTNNILEITTN